MYRLIAVAVLVAGTAAGADAAPVPEALKLRPPALKAEAAGDRTAVTTTEECEFRIVAVRNGKVDDDLSTSHKETVREEYTQDVLERPAGAGRATRLTRAYRIADRTDVPGGRTIRPYEGKTVLVEKKGDKYAFTVGGQPLGGDDAAALTEEFNSAGGESPGAADFLPGKGVKDGDTWTPNVGKVAGWIEAGSDFLVDRDKSKATGKLVRSYERGGRRFGVFELTLAIAFKGMKGEDGKEEPLGAGSTFTAAALLDVCTDGTSHTGTQKWGWTFDITVVGDDDTVVKVAARAKTSRVVEDLKAK